MCQGYCPSKTVQLCIWDMGQGDGLFCPAAFLAKNNDDSVMDEEDHDWRLRDEAAKEIIRRITGCESVSDFQRFDLSAQKEFAKELYIEGLSIRQIARMTGMSKSTVARAVKIGEDETPETDSMSLRESEESAYCLNTETIW